MTSSDVSTRPSLAHARAVLQGGNPLRILFLGDSITNGASVCRFEESWVALWVEHLRERHGVPVEFANVSQGGRTSEDVVPIAGVAALEHAPHLAVIAFGVNDQKAMRKRRFSRRRTVSPDEYGANIAEAARLVQYRCGADVVLVAPCRLPVARESGRYRDVLRHLAAEHGYGFADPLEFWHDGPELIAQDGVHPSANGHRLYAEALIAHVDL